jgi:hypothetical protein
MILIMAGWWSGSTEFYDYPYIGNVIIPTDELIFFRGAQTTNQKGILYVFIDC